jgi:hypothetical protein
LPSPARHVSIRFRVPHPKNSKNDKELIKI